MVFEIHEKPELLAKIQESLHADLNIEEDEREDKEYQERKRLEALKAEQDNWDE